MKQIFKVLGVLTMLVVSLNSFAQLNTEGAFGGAAEDSIVSVNPTVDGNGFIVYGISNSFSASSEIFLMRTDNAGNYAWATNISETNVNYQPICAIEANGSTPANENYIVVFHTNNSSTMKISNYNRNSDSFTWTTQIDAQINEIGTHGIVRTNNGYVFITHAYSSLQRTSVISIDNSGSLRGFLSEQHSSSVTTDIVTDAAGNIFLAGTATDSQNIFLKQVDENLNSTGIGEKFYGVALDQGGTIRADYVQVVRDANNNFVIATNYYQNHKAGKSIIKVDSNGDNPQAWEYGIQGQADFYIRDIAVVADGYVFTGHTSDNHTSSAGDKDILFVKTTEAMSLDKSSIFGDTEEDMGLWIFGNSDNTVTIFGRSLSFSSDQTADIYVIKTGSAGNTLCNERTVSFALESEVPSATAGSIYDGNPSASDNGSTAATFVTTDVKFTALCGCTQALSLETSGAACEGEPVMFTDLGGNLNYTWDFGPGVTDSTTVNGTIYITYDAPGIRYVSVGVANNSCFEAATKAVVIYPVPDITITGNTTVCTGVPEDYTSAVTPADGGPWQYNWDFGQEATPQLHTAKNVNGIVFTGDSRVVPVSLTVFDAHCSNIQTLDVSVTKAPEAGFSASSTQCQGTAIDFNNHGSTGVSYNWDFGTTQVVNTSTNENPSFTFNQYGEFKVQQIVSSGACKDTAFEYIEVHATPVIAFISNAGTQNCVGDEVSFTSTVTPNLVGKDWEYRWDFGQGANLEFSSAKIPSSVIYRQGGTKTVTFEVTSDFCGTSLSQTISIDDLPNPNVIANDTVCANKCLAIGGAEIVGANYLWSPATTLSNATSANPTACPIASYTTYYVDVTDANGCKNRDSVSVSMLQAAIANAGVDVDICYGESIQIGAAEIEGQTYFWYPNTTISSISDPNPIVNPNETTVYTVGASYKGCEVITDEVTVTVHQLPNVRAYINDHLEEIQIAKGESVQLYGAGAVNYEWAPWTGLNVEGIYNPVTTPEETIEYVLEGTDMYGCKNSDTVNITVIAPNFWVPNSFTPNEDGKNDYFNVYTKETVDFELTIYSRSGQIVFYTTDKDAGWDGTIQASGETLPQGAYVYHVQGTYTDGNLFEDKGVINLIR